MPSIKRNGRFVFINPAELKKMLAAGAARKIGAMPAYEEIVKVKSPKDLDSVQDEDQASQQYETKVMEAAPRATPRRRALKKKTDDA